MNIGPRNPFSHGPDDGGRIEPDPGDELYGQASEAEWQPDQPDNDVDGEPGDRAVKDDGSDIMGDDWPQADLSPEKAAEAEKVFRENIRGLRLVYSAWTSKIIGVATPEPKSWTWRVTSLETPTGRLFRQIGINFSADVAVQAADQVSAQLSDLDEVVMVAPAFVDSRLAWLKLCNVAVQGVAHHLGLSFIAPELGALVQQTLSPMVDPDNRSSSLVKALQIIDITVGASTGCLNPAVYGFVAAEASALIQKRTRGITQAELDQLEAMIRRSQASGTRCPTR